MVVEREGEGLERPLFRKGVAAVSAFRDCDGARPPYWIVWI